MRKSTYCLLTTLLATALAAPLLAQERERQVADRIRQQLEANDTSGALMEARAAAREYSDSTVIIQLLGGVLFKTGHLDEARSAFQRAIELAPDQSVDYYNLARVDLALKRFPEVVDALTRFLRSEPNDAQARVLLGRALYNLNQTLPAIEQFRAALAINDKLPLAHFHLGFAEQSLGRRVEARGEFEKEMRITPTFDEPYWMAGNIELEENNLGAAESLFRSAIQLKPQSFAPHFGLARALDQRDRLGEAEAEFVSALATNPQSIEAHYALGRLYWKMGKAQEAQQQFEIVTRLHNRDRE